MSNKTLPNTFARYIENAQHHATAVLMSLELGPNAERFPCPVCAGEGAIVKTVTYSRLRNQSEFLKTSSGREITGKEVVFCPVCHGSGIDEKALVEFVKSGNGEVA